MTSRPDGNPKRLNGPLDRQASSREMLQLIHDEMMRPSMRHRDPNAASALGKAIGDERPSDADLRSSRPVDVVGREDGTQERDSL